MKMDQKQKYLQQSLFTKPSQGSQLSKDSLNKYKKKQPTQNKLQSKPQSYNRQSTSSTSKNQFQKYFLDTTNVFYQDRQSLKQLQTTRFRLKILLPVWFFMAVTYLIISRIHAYQGHCPQNATCKVFIRCNPGYELSSDGLFCHMQSSIISQIENICRFQIEQLKLQYGDNDCLENVTHNQPPFKDVDELTQSITKTMSPSLKIQIEKKIHDFLNNQTNQAILQFGFLQGKVIPLVKKHSFVCWIQLASSTKQFKVLSIVLSLATLLTVWSLISYKREQKVKQIYNYLKEKVITETKVNITLLTDEIKSIYGQLDQNIWIKIDEERKKDGKIGYFEDQFLYWKLIV